MENPYNYFLIFNRLLNRHYTCLNCQLSNQFIECEERWTKWNQEYITVKCYSCEVISNFNLFYYCIIPRP